LLKPVLDMLRSEQKRAYDKDKWEAQLKPGGCVMVYALPSESQGPEHKVARPFHGPYVVISVTPTNPKVYLVPKPSDLTIFVILSRVRCYLEQSNEVWTCSKNHRNRAKKWQAPVVDVQPTSTVYNIVDHLLEQEVVR